MKILILGCGYVGIRLKNKLSCAGTELPTKCTGDLIPFDFYNISTWEILDQFDACVITFKMEEVKQAQKLREKLRNKKIIILSTAKVFLNSIPDGTISEETELSQSSRNYCEELFLPTAIIMHCGLIWGPHRQPEKWFENKRIHNGNKLINLIHVDDLCEIITILLTNDTIHERLLVASPRTYKWSDIAIKYGVNLSQKENGSESRSFNTKKLTSLLPQNFKFTEPL
jgi:hypothetical protein